MKAIVVFISILFCISCSSLQPIEQSASGLQFINIDVGDRIEIETTEGRDYKFTVSEVTESSVRGGGHIVPVSEITQLNKIVPSKAKTLTVFAMGALAVFVALAADSAYLGGH